MFYVLQYLAYSEYPVPAARIRPAGKSPCEVARELRGQTRLLTILIAALHSALAIIAFVSHVHCDGSVTSSGILYIFVVVMLVLTSVRKIGAVTFLAAVTATLTHMVTLWPSTLIVQVSASLSLASCIVFRPWTSLSMVR